MIKLKQEVNKSEIMRELKAEAEIAFENTWQKEMQIRAYLNGAHDLFKKLRIAHVSGSLPPAEQLAKEIGEMTDEEFEKNCKSFRGNDR